MIFYSKHIFLKKHTISTDTNYNYLFSWIYLCFIKKSQKYQYMTDNIKFNTRKASFILKYPFLVKEVIQL